MEDQRDLISNHEQLPMLGQRPGAPERYVWAAGGPPGPGPVVVCRGFRWSARLGVRGGGGSGSRSSSSWLILSRSLAHPGLRFSLL